MTFMAPHALWLLLLGPIVWWLARRRRFRADVRVPHLAVLEAVLAPRDLTPVLPPWRALLLVAALAAGVLALADPRPLAPAPRRVVLLAAGDTAAVDAARARAEAELAEDDVVLARVRPAGLERVADPPRDGDHRRPWPDAARRAAAAAAGPGGHVIEFAAAAPAPAALEPPAAPPPRPAIVVTARARAPVPRWLAAALGAMPDLVSRAGAVDRDALAAALRELPDAFVVGLGVGPSAAPAADWLCIGPPESDEALPARAGPASAAVGVRWSGAHPVSRGLSAAGIELDAHAPAAPDPRFTPLLVTDRGIAIVAGAHARGARTVALLGDPGRALARYPAWPRFVRRAVAWLAAERAADVRPRLRAGSGELPAADAPALDLPAWRGATRGAVRLPPGERDLSEGRALAIEADPFAPEPWPAAAAPALPPRERRAAGEGPAPWLALAALVALAAAVARRPGNPPDGGGVPSR